MILTFQYFFILIPILINISQKIYQFDPQSAPNGAMLGSSGRSWRFPGPLFCLSGTFWGSLGGPLGLSRALLAPFSSIQVLQEPSQEDFHRFFSEFHQEILNFKYGNNRFHTYLPIPYHSYFLSFQSLQSLLPSTPPTIQASNPPMGPSGMRVAFELITVAFN